MHSMASLWVPRCTGTAQVDGLTRENVASHLQKYRLRIKKIAGLSVADEISPELAAQVRAAPGV